MMLTYRGKEAMSEFPSCYRAIKL